MLPLLLTGITLLEIASGQDCNQTFSGSSGLILSPDFAYRPYSNNLDCQYDIKVSSGYGIKLYWWDGFDVKGYMPSCTADYVEIFIGCGRNSIGRYCNANNSFTKPFDMYSADQCMRIKFRSDSSVAGRGFRVSYSSFLLSRGPSSLYESRCHYLSTTLTANSGIISFEEWPSYPGPLKDCKWKIEVGRKHVIVAFMDLYLDNDCKKMFVEVRGGDNDQDFIYLKAIQGPLCVTGYTFSLTSTEESVWIMFKSGRRISSFSRGFVAGYILYEPVNPSSPSAEQFKTTVNPSSPFSKAKPTGINPSSPCTEKIKTTKTTSSSSFTEHFTTTKTTSSSSFTEHFTTTKKPEPTTGKTGATEPVSTTPGNSTIIGILVGVICLLAVITFGVLLLFFLSRRRRIIQNAQQRPFANELEQEESTQQPEHTTLPQQPSNTLPTQE